MITSLILSSYGGMAVRGPADDKAHVWTIALNDDVFKDGALLLVSARDGSTLGTMRSMPSSII